MARRVRVNPLRPGDLQLPQAEAHHLRDVLRLRQGDEVELFDDAGNTARATLVRCEAGGVVARVAAMLATEVGHFTWTLAAAVPKAARADWLVEKLSELGTGAFVPLATRRSVVLPEGKNKLERWERLAAEAAKQSRRAGVMRIAPLTTLPQAIEGAVAGGTGWYFATEVEAVSAADAVGSLVGQVAATPTNHLTLFVGPEGGWAAEELAAFAAAGLTAVRLTATILRVETAAVTAAALLATLIAPRRQHRAEASVRSALPAAATDPT